MLSAPYKQLLTEVHAKRPRGKRWGTTGGRNAGFDLSRALHGRADVKSVLDFGAGHGTLGDFMRTMRPDLEWHEYDPGLPEKARLPERTFDFIVSSDVMEHVEPDCLQETIAWQKEHATVGMFHHIACDPCGLILPDGRNAHLITEDVEFWIDQYQDEQWDLMFAAQCRQLKRGRLKNHCIVQLDRR